MRLWRIAHVWLLLHAQSIGVLPMLLLTATVSGIILASLVPLPSKPTLTTLGRVANLRLYDSKFGSQPFAIVDMPDGRTVTVRLPLSQRCTVGSSIAISDTTLVWGHRYAAGFGGGCAP